MMQTPGATDDLGAGAPAVARRPRNWLADGFHHLGEQFALLFRTAARFTRHPRQFSIDWAEGRFRAFNPLAFFATAAGVTGTLGVLVERATAGEGTRAMSTTMGFVLQEVEPYASYFLLGLLCHLCLVPLVGRGRRPWHTTLGISLFAGGGPAAAADVLGFGLQVALRVSRDEAGALTSAAVDSLAAGSILLANGVFLVAFAAGLAGVHRVRLWRILVALLVALGLLAVLRVVVFKLVIPGEWL